MLAALCLVVTMSGGAVIVVDRREQPLFGSGGVALAPLHSGGHETTFELLSPLDTGSGGDQQTSVADAGITTLRTRTVAPLRKGPVERFLDVPNVCESVNAILTAIDAKLPGYPTTLEVVADPNEGDNGAFLMISVCMGPDDERGAEVVEELIDREWMPLAPELRRVLGVGRELVPVG